MADVQDDDQWLYGDEKDESKEDGEINDKGDEGEKSPATENGVEKETSMEEGEKEDDGAEGKNDGEGEEMEKEKDKEDGDKEEGEKGDEDSSDEDDVTITIGVLKTQPDIIQAPSAPHGARFQPKAAPTTGLKDEDFTSPGKVNGVPVGDFSYNDMEDKPWRKPGADISDYFNYGFNEETWFKYCERQKRMRVTESGAGLSGLGVSITKPFGNAGSTNIPVAIVNDNSKYGGTSSRPRAGPPPRPINKPGQNDINSSKTSTIQVMTADRREYSNKVMNGPPPPVQTSFIPGYNDMEFGGNPYGDTYYPPPEAPPYYGGPPPFPSIHWGGSDAPISNQSSWEGGGGGGGGGGHNVTPVSSSNNYFDESSNISAPPPVQEQEEERHSRSRRSHRSRSRSPTRHKHSSSRHRSRSRSPSHRHKRKRSKRERDTD